MANSLNSSGRGRNTTCFTCDQEILGVKISLSNSVTTHSNTAIPVKISELMGEDFLVILTGEDYICKRCNVLFNLMDRLQSELSIVQNALLGHIRSKYNLPGMSDTNTTGEIQLSVNGVPYSEFAKMNNIDSPQPKPQVNSLLPTKLQSPPKPSGTNNSASKTTKVYKCGFCEFQSKELLIVKEHMRGHMNIDSTKKAEKRLGSPIPPRPIKRKLFRCQVCSESYFDRKSCLSHIKATHTGENSLSQKTSSLKSSSINQTTDYVSLLNGSQDIKKTNDVSQDMQGIQEAVSTPEVLLQEASQETQGVTQETTQETPIPEESSHSTTEQDSITSSKEIQENGTTLEGVLRLEESQETCDNKVVDDSTSKTLGLDLDAMLAALHSESNNSDGTAVKTESES